MENKPAQFGEVEQNHTEMRGVMPAYIWVVLERLGLFTHEDDDDAFDPSKRKKKRVRNYLIGLVGKFFAYDQETPATANKNEQSEAHRSILLIDVETDPEAINEEESAERTKAIQSEPKEIPEQPEEQQNEPEFTTEHRVNRVKKTDIFYDARPQNQNLASEKNQENGTEVSKAKPSKDSKPSLLGLDISKRLSSNPNEKLRKKAKTMHRKLKKIEKEERQLKEVQKKQQKQIKKLRSKRNLPIYASKAQPAREIPLEKPKKEQLSNKNQIEQTKQVILKQHVHPDTHESTPVSKRNDEKFPQTDETSVYRLEKTIKKVKQTPENNNPPESYYQQTRETINRPTPLTKAAAGFSAAVAQASLKIPSRSTYNPPVATTQSLQPAYPRVNPPPTMYKNAVKTGALSGLVFIVVFLVLIALGVI